MSWPVWQHIPKEKQSMATLFEPSFASAGGQTLMEERTTTRLPK